MRERRRRPVTTRTARRGVMLMTMPRAMVDCKVWRAGLLTLRSLGFRV
jgi:hypothetical protein